MMRPVGEDLKMYLYRRPVDMRRGRNGLAALAREAMQRKVLYWERNGFAMWSKKIGSEEKFHWPRLVEEEVIHLTGEQLGWLLDGYDVWAQPHRI